MQPVLEVTRMMNDLREFQFVTQFVQGEADRHQARSTRSCRSMTADGERPMRSLDIAGTGMQAQQTNVEVISNNIANMTTTGFKRRRAEFQDLIYQNLRRVGSNSSDTGTHRAGRRAGRAGRQDRGDLPDQRAGQLQQTSNSLDLAIQGNGYFQVTLPSATPPTPATARSACRPTARSSPPTATWCSPASPSRSNAIA